MDLKNFKNYQLHLNQNLLAIDFGTKVIGLATFCPGQDPFPTPYGRIICQGQNNDLQKLQQIISDEAIEAIIIGLPKFLDGQETRMSKIVENFGDALAKKVGNIPIFYQEESLSTKEAEERMKNSPRYNYKVDPRQIDALAASIILEEYICSL